jgi:hypothetical protein
MAKFILILLLVVLILTLHLGILPSIYQPITRYFSLPIVFISFVAFLGSTEMALFCACLLGLSLDFYSPFFFGFYTLVFLLSILVIQFFITNFFQHKNLGSLLAANVLPLFVYQLVYAVYYFFSPRLSGLLSTHLLIFFWQILVYSYSLLFLFSLL